MFQTWMKLFVVCARARNMSRGHWDRGDYSGHMERLRHAWGQLDNPEDAEAAAERLGEADLYAEMLAAD